MLPIACFLLSLLCAAPEVSSVVVRRRLHGVSPFPNPKAYTLVDSSANNTHEHYVRNLPSFSSSQKKGKKLGARYADFVNVFLGTARGDVNKAADVGYGHTVPAATVPFGMVSVGPDTDSNDGGGYHYDDANITSFSVTHMSGPGCNGANGDFPIKPLAEGMETEDEYPFLEGHAYEVGEPGYYKLGMPKVGMQVEFTATTRVALARIAYPTGRARLALDMSHTNAIDHNNVSTTTHIDKRNFAATMGSGRFCVPWFTPKGYLVHMHMETNTDIVKITKVTDRITVLEFDVSTNPRRELIYKMGFSYVSQSNAKKNIDQETEPKRFDFDGIRMAASSRWEGILSSIEVKGGNYRDLVKFYSALYHMTVGPNTFSDANGDFLQFDNSTATLSTGQIHYTSLSNWDVYRSLTPFQAIMFPKEASDVAQTHVRDAEVCGALPHWVNGNTDQPIMNGDHGPLIIAQTYMFGARDFDVQKAFDFMQKSTFDPNSKCQGVRSLDTDGFYLAHGYVDRSVSATIEANARDFASAQMAHALKRQEIAARFLKLAYGYRELFDTATKFLRAKGPNGWGDPEGGFQEGKKEQYFWGVTHDFPGLISKLGKEAALARLKKYFDYSNLSSGQGGRTMFIGNENNLGTPFVFNYLGFYNETQRAVNAIRESCFTETVGGIPGNEDFGAESGWYLWSTLGLYPLKPGVPGFTLFNPLFERVVIHLPNGKDVTIVAEGDLKVDHYVCGYALTKKPKGPVKDHEAPWMALDDFMEGPGIKFTMCRDPQPSWPEIKIFELEPYGDEEEEDSSGVRCVSSLLLVMGAFFSGALW